MSFSQITSKLLKPFDNLVAEIGAEISHVSSNKILEYQMSVYKKCYYTKTILHRSSPVKLLDIYYPVRLTKKNFSKKRKAEEILFSKVVEEQQYITVSGSAGMGKSMMIKYLFIQIVDKQEHIPIKIELRDLEKYSNSFEVYVKELFDMMKLSTNARITDRLLSSGMFYFLLDGFDELTSNVRYKVITEIDSFIEKYQYNRFFITTRPHVNIELLPLFNNFEIKNLSELEIKEFIIRQLPRTEVHLGEKIIAAIDSGDRHGYDTFLKNPLLLSMFILTFQSYSSLPSKKNRFYSQVFETLFQSHDSLSKLGFERKKESGLNHEQIKVVLNAFAFIALLENELVFSKDYFINKVSLIKSKSNSFHFESDKLLEDFLVALCLIIKEGRDYSFSHKSLHEYFAALYVSGLNNINKNKAYDKIYNLMFSELTFVNPGLLNFISLLVELDYESVNKKIVFPLFDLIIEKGKKIFQDDSESRYIFPSFVYFLLNDTLKDIIETNEQDGIINEYMNLRKSVDFKRKQSKEELAEMVKSSKENQRDLLNKILFTMHFPKNFFVELEKIFENEKSRILMKIERDKQMDTDIIELI